MTSRIATGLIASAAALAFAGVAAADGHAPKLPKSMVWSAYDLGSSGYAEAAGIANAFRKNFGTRIRIVPAGTSIGRLLPITTGKVSYGFLANEVFFAAEGTYDFAVREWGPQDLRIVVGRVATVGLATAGDIGVKELADLRGKRIGFVKANPSVNVKNDGYLAFGGLTRDDVEQVWFGSYRAMKDALLANQLDAFGSVTTSANMRQIEASPRGLYWPPFRPDNKAGWDAMKSIISFVKPVEETRGAALSEENPTWLVGYRYPMITTYARQSAEEVYNLVKALDMSFDDYKNTTASSFNWALDPAGRPPADAPWHEGSIRYAKEKGYWTAEDQAWHDERLARLEKVIEVWDMANGDFDAMRLEKKEKGEKVNVAEEWPVWWQRYRDEHL